MNTEPANKCGLKREDFQTTVNGKKTDLCHLYTSDAADEQHCVDLGGDDRNKKDEDKKASTRVVFLITSALRRYKSSSEILKQYFDKWINSSFVENSQTIQKIKSSRTIIKVQKSGIVEKMQPKEEDELIAIPLSGIVTPLLKEDGIFITSGIINTMEEAVKEAMLANHFEILEINHMKDWVSITAKKA